MKYKARITRLSDGAQVVIEENNEWPNKVEQDRDEEWRGIDFMWREGNYSCDCNRALMFIRAFEKREPEDDEETECTEGRYKAELQLDGETDWREIIT